MTKIKDFWNRRNRFQKILLGALGGFVVLSALFGNSSSDSTSLSPSASESAPEPQSTEESTNTPKSDLTTEQGLTNAIKDKLGTKTNRDVPKNVNVSFDGRDLYVDFALDDNLNADWIIGGGWSAAEDIIKLAQASGLVDNLTVNGTFPLQDKYGNSLGEVSVFTANFLDNSIPKINTEAFVGEMYAEVATNWRVHPAMKN